MIHRQDAKEEEVSGLFVSSKLGDLGVLAVRFQQFSPSGSRRRYRLHLVANWLLCSHSYTTMPVAVKLSDSLAEDARTASADADRSLTGQIEHWARLGKGVEPLFTAPIIASLKKSGGNIDSLEDPRERKSLLDALTKLRLNPTFAESAAFLTSSYSPLYEADPAIPDGIVQVLADGSRVHGKFVNRIFVPNE